MSTAREKFCNIMFSVSSTVFIWHIDHNIAVVAAKRIVYLFQHIQHNRLVTAQLGHRVERHAGRYHQVVLTQVLANY